MSIPESDVKLFAFQGNLTVDEYRLQWKKVHARLLAMEQDLEAPRAKPDLDNFLRPLNAMHHGLHALEGPATVWTNLSTCAEMREEGREVQKATSLIRSRLSMHALHSKQMLQIDLEPLDEGAKRLVELMRDEYRIQGANLDEASRHEIQDLRKQLTDVRLEFETNINEDERSFEVSPEKLEGLPQDFVDAHPVIDGKVKLTSKTADMIPIVTFCKSDDVRKEMFLCFSDRGFPKNRDVLCQMLHLRHQIASKLGFKDWAELSMLTESVRTSQLASDFIKDTVEAVRASADLHLKRLEEVMQRDLPGMTQLQRWQLPYAENVLSREALQGFDEAAVRPYLRLGQVRKGIFTLVEDQFGLRLKELALPVWHDSVKVYQVFDAASGDTTPVGHFYMDLHPRQNKFSHACCGAIKYKNETDPLTSICLMCNFPEGDDAQLTYDQAKTFLHEMFHGVHALCGSLQIPWKRIAGFGVETDFVETPSQVIEAWLTDCKFLDTFAVNEHGQTIPDEMVAALQKRDRLQRPRFVRGQMRHAATSLTLHQKPSLLGIVADDDPEVISSACAAFVGDILPECGHQVLNFGHLAGYDAKYYSYMWATAINQDLLTVFKDGHMMDKETCIRFRKTVLEKGGSKPALDLVQDFLGRPLSQEAFQRWLRCEE